MGTNTLSALSSGRAIEVAKERFHDAASQSTFLIESIPFAEASDHLDTLPARQGAAVDRDSLRKRIESERSVAKSGRRKPLNVAFGSVPSTVAPKERKIATAHKDMLTRSPGFVMDYALLATATDFVFTNGATYWVTNIVTLNGVTTLEGGAVIKFSADYGSGPRIGVTGTIDCRTTPYAPVIFTSEADQSVGEVIKTNSLSGYYGAAQLRTPTANTNLFDLHDLRFNYGAIGLRLSGSAASTLANIQASKCSKGVDVWNATANVRNYLASDCLYPFGVTVSSIYGEHVTVHNADYIWYGGNGSLSLTNSLLISITNSASGPVFTSCANLASDSGVFATVGAGEHYLSETSPYRNVGAAVSATTAAILKRGTTEAPIVLTGTYNEDIQLSTRHLGDAALPDIGYHYPVVDYIADTLVVTNHTLSLGFGVVIANYNATGIWLYNNSSLISTGLATSPNRFVRYNCVQEKPVALGSGTIAPFIPYHYSTGYTSSATIRFTEFSGQNGYHIYDAYDFQFNTLSVADSQFSGGWVNISYPYSPTHSFAFTNNLFARCHLQVSSANTGSFFNNLFWNQTVLLSSSGTNLTFKDNIFNNAYIDTFDDAIGANNAYLNYPGTVSRLYPTNANDVVVSSFAYATATSPNGLPGYFYQSSTNLVDRGSRSAGTATLYHYTARTNQAKESTSTVDIGFHYVALDGSNLPIDTDADGVPDYLEDLNGNGTSDGSETNWQTYNSRNSLASPTDTRIYTPLK